MNRPPRPSGAFKRKLKKEREVNLKKSNKVLDSYFSIAGSSSQPQQLADKHNASGTIILIVIRAVQKNVGPL